MSNLEARIKDLESKLEITKACLEEAKEAGYKLHRLIARSRQDKLFSLGESLYNNAMTTISKIWPENE